MSIAMILIVATLAALGLYVLVIVTRRYLKWRGTRVITCPENHKPAAVEVDAGHAALTATIDAPTQVRLKQCSRWPEMQNCGQECVRQIELAPEGCLVRTMLANWYEGKRCAFCGEEFGAIHTWDNKPGLLSPDGKAMLCTAVAAEKLPETLETHKPVCWNCLIAEEFRQLHPELVVDRPGTVHHVTHAHRKVG